MTKEQRLKKLRIDIYNAKSIFQEMMEDGGFELDEMLEFIANLRSMEAKYEALKKTDSDGNERN